jgi:hypothetical protein
MSKCLKNRRDGFALALTILVVTGLAVLASGAMMVGMNSTMIRHYSVTQDELGSIADAGLEFARARLNSDPALYPASGFAALETDAVVIGAGGVAIPNVTRSTFIGPVGITSGQFGVHGAIVTIVTSGPNTIIRRANVVQASFSRFAYFTNIEGAIVFGGGDQILGPAHSNDNIEIHSTGATFNAALTVSGTIQNPGNATYVQGFTEGAPVIPLPQLANLAALQVQAVDGGMSFVTTSGNAQGRARLRLEFMARDLNSDGDSIDDNEGFVRVYRAKNNNSWAVGANGTDLRTSRNCGHFDNNNPSGGAHTGTGLFWAAGEHPTTGHDREDALTHSQRRCLLGGDSLITRGWVRDNSDGTWLDWGGTVSPLLSAFSDDEQLFPITRALNPSFKGVIYVDGDVAVSGVVRGRVTVAATGNIVIADDITYATNVAAGTCEDILGLFAGGNVVISNTPLNSPWRINGSGTWRTYDNTPDEFIDAFILTLNSFTVEGFNIGPDDAEECQGTDWGRGCIFLNGGIIQNIRGAVGQSSGTGYVKRYGYDPCGATAPPPYFPTTGRFSRNAYYEVDPTDFDPAAYFAMLAAGT